MAPLARCVGYTDICTTGYLVWFKKRNQWQAEQRKRRRLENGGESGPVGRGVGGAMRGFVQQRRDVLANSYWQIVQVYCAGLVEWWRYSWQ